MGRKKTTPVDVENQQVIDETIEEQIEEVAVAPELRGVVCKCDRLNVRKKPNGDADVICVINKGTNVLINEEKSTKDFYAVEVNPHTSGYCMKKYLAIEQ